MEVLFFKLLYFTPTILFKSNQFLFINWYDTSNILTGNNEFKIYITLCFMTTKYQQQSATDVVFRLFPVSTCEHNNLFFRMKLHH